MVFGRFGTQQIRQRTEIDHLLRDVNKIDSISAQMLLREAYELSYHIFDHDQGTYHPWNLVMERPKENYNKYGTLYRTIHTYRLREVHKRFGYSLTEFLDQPREIVDLIFEICMMEDKADTTAFENVREEMDEAFKSSKGPEL